MIKQVIIAIFTWALLATAVNAFEIQVNVKNKTKKMAAYGLDYIELIDPHTQKVLVHKEKPGPRVNFPNLPDDPKITYLVKLKYKTIDYIKVIHYQKKKLEKVNVDVFEVTYDFDESIDLYKVIYISYYDGFLILKTMYIFQNVTQSVYADPGAPDKGFLVYIPKETIAAEATVYKSFSEDTPESAFPVALASIDEKNSIYLVKSALEPGSNVITLWEAFKYDGNEVEIPMQNIYPQEDNPVIVFDMEGMSLALKENADWDTTVRLNETLEIDSISLPDHDKRMTLVISGGIPEPLPPNLSGLKQSAPTTIEPTVSIDFKILMPVIFILLTIAIMYYLNINPSWLQNQRAKSKNRIEFDLQNLDKTILSETRKNSRRKQLERRLLYLNDFLK
ncbi:MAG: hypothetical protein ABUK01_08885 [Leptospirales bacterium]